MIQTRLKIRYEKNMGNAVEPPIFKDRIKGFHLISLAERLKIPTRLETSYIMGIPPVTWYGYTNSKTKEGDDIANTLKPIERASICILARLGFTFPERVQRTRYPDAQHLFSKLKETKPNASLNHFSKLLGREISAGHRWLKRGHSFDGTTRRLALHLNDYLDEGRLPDWEKLVEHETRLRNAKGAKSLALPDPDKPLPRKEIEGKPLRERLLVAGDIETIKNACELEIQDSLYHLGISQKKWGDLMKSDPLTPIRDPSLSILMRLYYQHPEDLDAVRLPMVPIDDVFEELNDPANNVPRTLHPDEVALLLGFTPACVQRWRLNTDAPNKVVNYSPQQQRLIAHFYQELKAGRFNDWYRIVMVEAQVRGIKNIWESGWS